MTDRNTIFAELVNELKATGSVNVRGFGTFSVRPTAARQGRNPRSGEAVDIPAGNKIAFKPAKALKETF